MNRFFFDDDIDMMIDCDDYLFLLASFPIKDHFSIQWMTKAISFPPHDRFRFDNDRYFEQKVNLLNNCRFLIWFYMQVLYSGKWLACIFTILARKQNLQPKRLLVTVLVVF